MMGVDQEVLSLKTALAPAKHELYQSIIKQISDVEGKTQLNASTVDNLYTEVINDIGSNDVSLINFLLEQLKPVLKLKAPNCIFSDEQKLSVFKSIVNLIKVPQEEKVLLLCFSYLDEFLTEIHLTNPDIEDVLNKTAEVLNKQDPVPVIIAACNFVFKFIKAQEKNILPFIHILPKLIFIPLSHSSSEVHSIAEKTVDTFPKVLLYFENPKASSVLLKLVKDTYCKNLLQIMKAKKDHYVLKVWNLIVDALGKTLHGNLMNLSPFFQIVEKAFKSPSDDVCKAAFISWKHLIDNLALDEEVLNNSRRLRFLLKPFKNVSRMSDSITSTVCESWWHLVWSLNHNLSSRFTEVCIPLLEYTIGKSISSLGEKSTSKTNNPTLMKKGCEMLIRLLEQPPNAAFGRISSPKKITSLTFSPLQTPLNVKEIARHFKELLPMIRALIEVFGNNKEMINQVDCLMKSLLFIVSSVVEDDSKESIDVVVSYVNLVNDITDLKLCPSSTCLKCIDILSKLPKSMLASHCFNGGICKPQNILCVNLLKLLFHSYVVENETSNKRYLPAYNRLVQAGLCDTLNPLSMTQKFIQMLKSVVASGNCPPEFTLELWTGIASPLLATIEKTQEVNEGDKQEHDFSCLFAVLLCPLEPMFPFSIPQLYSKPSFQLWSDLYKCFIRNAELVPTTFPNETSENFCAKLKNYVSENELKDPQTFENFCHLFQILLESMDFSSFSSTSSQGIVNILAKQKKPLGNIKSFTDLLSLLLNSFCSNFIDGEEEIYQSCTPKAQKRGHVYKAAMPMDILKTFFQNLKSGSLIRSVLEEIIQPISKLFSTGQKKFTSNPVCSKLETLLNVMMSSIEMYYSGPYDSEFLTLMSPLLEVCFGHNRRQIKERCRRFWFASFANVSSTLKYPESLKNVMKKNKLPLLSGESISPLDDMSLTQELGVIEDSEVMLESSDGLKGTFVKPFEVLTPKVAKEPPSSAQPGSSKTIKIGPKRSVDELPDEEFVIINSSSTARRKSVRKRRSFVPALYNDLSQSQDTATFGGSSESFDSSCEIVESKPNLVPENPSVSVEAEKIHESVKEEPADVTSSPDFQDLPVEELNKSNGDLRSKKNTVSDTLPELVSSHEKLAPEATVNEIVDIKMDTSEAPSVKENSDSHSLCIDANQELKKDRSIYVRPPTPHVRKTYSRKSVSGRKRALSETFSLLSPQRSTGKPNDVIDLSDSDEIIPSSQSSSENENPVETSARTSGNIVCKSTVAKRRKSEPPGLMPSTEDPIEVTVSNDVEECPETPADLMTLPEPESHFKAEPECVVDESASVMPLKSSENLLSSEEPIPKAEVLSDILKPVEGMCLNVAENTPPLFEDVFLVQNALLETDTKESKSVSTEMKLQTASDVNKEASKGTRSRSARIAARKSTDHPIKRVSKKVPKRKSMIELPQTEHSCKKLKSSSAIRMLENATKEEDSSNLNSQTDHTCKKAKCSSTFTVLENATEEDTCKKAKCSSAVLMLETAAEIKDSAIQHNPIKKSISSEDIKEVYSIELCDSTPAVTNSFSDDSLMTDVTKVISDIKDKLSSFSDTYSCEVFSQGETVEPIEISPSAKEVCELVDDIEETAELGSHYPDDNVFASPGKVDESKDLVKTEDAQETHEKIPCNSYLENSSKKEPIPESLVESGLDNLNVEVSIVPLDSKEGCDPIEEVETDRRICVDPLSSDKNVSGFNPNSQEIIGSESQCDKSLNSEPCSEQTEPVSSSKNFWDEVVGASQETCDQEISTNSSQNISLNENIDSSVEKESESVKVDRLNNLPGSESKVEEMEFTNGQNLLENQASSGIEDRPLNQEQCDKQEVVNSSDIFELKENIHSSLKAESYSEESKQLESSLEVGEEVSISSSDPIKFYSEAMEFESVASSTQNELESEEISFKCTQKSALVSLSDYGSSSCEESPQLEGTNASEIISPFELKESFRLEPVEAVNKTEDSVEKGLVNGKTANSPAIVLIEKLEETSGFKVAEEVKDHAPSEKEGSVVDKSEGASRKRKPKCPVRSPFNFRQRSTILVSSVPHKKTENDLPKSILSISNKPDDTLAKKIKITHSKGRSKEVTPMEKDRECTPSSSTNSAIAGVKRVPDPSKMSFDELTSMNTRANANIALQTRRLKLLTTSQQSIDVEPLGESLEVEDYGTENSAMDTSSLIAGSILKKRQSSEYLSSKNRKVTFADPLYEELLFRKEENSLQCSKSLKDQGSETLTEKGKDANSNLQLTDDASAEIENSDPLTVYSKLPVSPLLVNCKESVRAILKDLTSPTWVCALETLLESRHIETIGDLCRLNIHELKALPFKSPKVLNLHKALAGYLARTQAETLDKLKNIDDGCVVGDLQEKEGEASISNDVNIAENAEGEIFESLAAELISNKIEHLSTQTLVSLSEKCFQEMAKRLKKS